MMLVYNLPATDAIYQRFAGIEGSAYFVGGLGMTALTMNNIVVVPIRTGVGYGWALGASIGYLKFTPTATWNRSEPDMTTSMTSSARASSVGSRSRPSARAVPRLITSSNLVGCSTGGSAGFSPLRIRST